MSRLKTRERQGRHARRAWSKGQQLLGERRSLPARPGTAKRPPPWLSGATIGHYERHAPDYLRFTLDHDIGESYTAFLAALDRTGGRRILDLGCGVGRDLRHFREAGYDAVGLDGSEAMAETARRLSRCPVWQQDIFELDLPEGRFDGVFANASLFHVPPRRLPTVLAALARALRLGGILFACNPIGHDEEGWFDERYVCLYSQRSWSRLVRRAGFRRIGVFHRPPGLPRRQQTWLATLWRRI